MYNILQHAHSGLRWLVLIGLLAAIISALTQWKSRVQDGTQLRWATIGMSIAHLQALVGLIIYFVSPKVQFTANTMKDGMLRFFTMEHTLMMVIALVLITIGHSKAKRKTITHEKAKTVFWYYLIALIIIIAAIPWPFRENLASGWF